MRKKFAYVFVSTAVVAAALIVNAPQASAEPVNCTKAFTVNNVSANVCMWWVNNVEGVGSNKGKMGWKILKIRVENRDTETMTGKMMVMRDRVADVRQIGPVAKRTPVNYTLNQWVANAGGSYLKVCLDTKSSVGGAKIHFRKGEPARAHSMLRSGQTPPIELCTIK